ncbi:enoyl-CoA hydratase-related protein [Erythrobacter aureus]|uniref:enoyl-CoA hydratase-related protein n=1 Tax=Erythrobacter aureus TaxID=2182384 RepID=UPI003A92794F
MARSPNESRVGHHVSIVDHCMVVRLDRPDAANALDVETCASMSCTFDQFAEDPDLHVAVVTGAGERHFCAGLDLRTMQPGQRVVLPPTGFAGLTSRLIHKPVIAAVNGTALGGGFELALACDIIIADPDACFGLPEPRVGQAALAGGLIRLSLSIGKHRAMDIILSGRTITGKEGSEMGFVSRLSAPGAALEKALDVAQDIAAAAPLAIQASKAVALTHERAQHLLAIQEKPPKAVEVMLDSKDAQEGAAAFLAKRTPHWQGR